MVRERWRDRVMISSLYPKGEEVIEEILRNIRWFWNCGGVPRSSSHSKDRRQGEKKDQEERQVGWVDLGPNLR